MSQYHVPVLLHETLSALEPKPDGIYLDGTAGGGGHSAAILRSLSENGRLICLDRDPDAIAELTGRFGGEDRVSIVQSEYSQMREVLTRLGIPSVDGILLDIGVSSHQFDCAERGFSFHNDAPLDMRMSQSGVSAADIVNNSEKNALAAIFRDYGEEKFAMSIASAICREREIKPIETTLELAEIIKSSVPQKVRREGHPARKCFQALRIAVNDEFGQLEKGIEEAFETLSVGGILAIITFHSLEDRIVKHRFKAFCEGCTCPPEFPVCVCGKTPRGRLVLKKAVEPSKEELEQNPRSRSSKLRAIKKLRD